MVDQYAGLRALHDLHGDDGFTVLAFPCNQFADQEPGSNEEILEFATSKYGVTFPMFAKIEVNGDGAAPLYQWLREQQPGDAETDAITWNFEKFLIDREGDVVQRFGPLVTPEEIGEVVPEYL
jgi:glutathione peroxidase